MHDELQEVSLPIAAEASNARPVCGICGGRQAADHPPGEARFLFRGLGFRGSIIGAPGEA